MTKRKDVLMNPKYFVPLSVSSCFAIIIGSAMLYLILSLTMLIIHYADSSKWETWTGICSVTADGHIICDGAPGNPGTISEVFGYRFLSWKPKTVECTIAKLNPHDYWDNSCVPVDTNG